MLRRRLTHLLVKTSGAQVAPPRAADSCWLDEDLGLCEQRLLDLGTENRFGAVAGYFRRVGGPLELRRVAWWGSALADIGCAAGSRRRDDDLLADAARFYLGVALFDDVVDFAPERTQALALPLHPSRLRHKLEGPTDPDARLLCAAPDLGLIVALFDRALEGIGRRLDRDPVWRGELADMLEAMYRSELTLSGTPLAAKTLPFLLIGHLALPATETAARVFFVELAQLLGLWDDWQDLLADGWALAANAHLGVRPGTPPRRLRGLAQGLWLKLMGTIPGHQVSRRLSRALEATLESARFLPFAARRKTEALLLHMLGGGFPTALIGHRPDARSRPAS